VPNVVKRINNALQRADELHHAEGNDSIDWFKPSSPMPKQASAECSTPSAHETDDRGGRRRRALRGSAVLGRRNAVTWAARCFVPTQEGVNKLVAARLAADLCDVPRC